MDEKRFSLNEIFVLLRETNILFTDKHLTLLSEDGEGNKSSIPMTLSDFITMNIAHQLVNDGLDKEEVIAAMSNAGYEENAYPNYEHYGISFPLRGGRNGKGKSTRRNKK